MLFVNSALLLLVSLGRPSDVLSPKNVATLRAVSSAAISPDAKRVAFVRLVPREAGVDEDGGPWNELWMLDLADGHERPFVTGKVDVGHVAWTPDGSGVAFVDTRGGDKHAALWIIPADGGEARRALAHDTDITGYSIAPDGKRVAFLAKDDRGEARKKREEKGFKQEVYEEDWLPDRVWIGTLSSGDAGGSPVEKPRALPIEGSVSDVEWSPVDDRLLVKLAPTPLVDDSYMYTRVRVVDARTGEIVARIQNPGKLGQVKWSPDGKRVALISAADFHDPSAGRLMVCDATGGEPVDLMPGIEADFSGIAWKSADELFALGSRGVRGTCASVRFGEKGGAKAKETRLESSDPVCTSFTLSKDGRHTALVGSEPTHPLELYTGSEEDSTVRRRTDSNPWLAGVRFAEQEVVKWRARDGLELEGILVHPLDEKKGERYPLILCVHGGPESHDDAGWQTGYSKPGQVAAAQGIATLYPNYRGSTGRGVAFSKLSQGDPAGKEFDDLVDAVDSLVARGLVDKTKVGITGGSYGGYATAWCSTKFSDRFAAGVMFVGISDHVSKVGTTDIPDEEYVVHMLKRPWEEWEKLLDRSPIAYAGQCRTPLLILGGKDDPRVNPGQSRELYRQLKMRGQAPVRLVIYPGEGHGNRKACSRLDYNLRMMQWMVHYLKGPGGAMPPYELDYGLGGTEAKKEEGAATPAGAAATAR